MSVEQTLATIARHLNAAGVTWALGASLMLKLHGLVEHANDVDLLVALPDAEKAVAILQSLAEQGGAGERKAPFLTEHFYEFVIGGQDVDLMSGYRIQHEGGVYEQPFDAESIAGYADVLGEQVPLSSLEDWYVSYQLIPAKAGKVELLERYFQEYGVAHPERLAKALAVSLSGEVRARIEAILGG